MYTYLTVEELLIIRYIPDTVLGSLSYLNLCASDGKESACSAGDPGLNPLVRKIPWREKWQLTPVFLPGKFHGQRSLADYSPWGHKDSYMT